ncbi:hypothetical protein [Thiobacillus sp.]|uniref:hypothetical protein n=1 Tax=Thiobacillus sp. TaxID=924 RepID=UPI0011D4CCB6|nr:hypothetical protein [Thiobacillus sp.]MBC2730520.1 hypothetical protein [Thiobacillus sp.]MBC2739257.1 hypothetical protein [Thiobacillus sp.]MBC2760458.1 hypothetical protein [Thiobacillus sp.]TXH75774.1 MAG: hypothetical protein E6Q82_04930 [Thiobacillus sp.]
MKPSTSKPRIQGEGDYDSAKKYDEQARSFAESGKVEQAARAAAPRNAQEQEDMQRAEREGRSHAKGDPKGERGEEPSRPKPAKEAPGKHPDGRNPIPEKVPGR